MIRIRFNEPDSSLWRKWVSECARATKALKSAFRRNQSFDISDLYKPQRIKKEIYLAPNGPFKGRCAFCETNVRDFQHGDIEHFRPKKGVTDEDDVPVKVQIDGVHMSHPGYYWLAYDWHNLLLSCTTCNQPGDDGIGKRNRFPVANGRWAATEDEIPQEQPLLFNPIDPNDEDPEDHLGIDLATGKLTMKNGSRRAKACIDIFGLNLRDQLCTDRQTAMNEVKAKWAELIISTDEEIIRTARQSLEKMQAGDLPYTLARRAQSNAIKQRIPGGR